MPVVLKFILLPPAAYLVGSIPWGLILILGLHATDIRRAGSGNIGATNARRIGGTAVGLLTLAGDILKGLVPLVLGYQLVGAQPPPWAAAYLSLLALACFLGHLFPVYLRFRDGGKGVATALGCFLAISPLACLVALLVFILFLCLTSRVSAASLAAAAILPLAVWQATASPAFTTCAALMAAMIIWRHNANIRRLLQGTEPRAFD
jgi:glycerol-3-phosphate acyltransferase PlsY